MIFIIFLKGFLKISKLTKNNSAFLTSLAHVHGKVKRLPYLFLASYNCNHLLIRCHSPLSTAHLQCTKLKLNQLTHAYALLWAGSICTRSASYFVHINVFFLLWNGKVCLQNTEISPSLSMPWNGWPLPWQSFHHTWNGSMSFLEKNT